MTEQQPMSMEEVQAQAVANLANKLAGTTWLVERAQNTITQILNMDSGKAVTPANQIAINLLVRIWNELRAVLILCQHGYALQAFSPAAVIYEAGLTVAAIGNSEEAAEKWFMHDVEERSYDNVKRLTEAGLKNLLGNDGAQKADTYYAVYRDLCMAKHINPKVQRHEGHNIDPDTKALNFAYGPDPSNEAVKKAWWVMSKAVKFMYPALDTFVKYYVPPECRQEANSLIKDLVKEHEELDKELFAELTAAGLVS